MHFSRSIIRVINSRRKRWAAHVARMGQKKNAYWSTVRKSEINRQEGKPNRRWGVFKGSSINKATVHDLESHD